MKILRKLSTFIALSMILLGNVTHISNAETFSTYTYLDKNIWTDEEIDEYMINLNSGSERMLLFYELYNYMPDDKIYEFDIDNFIFTYDVHMDNIVLTPELLKFTTEPRGLGGLEYYIIYAAEKYNINPLFIVAVARHESGNGTSYFSQHRNNLFGMNAVDWDPHLAFWYDTKEDSIYDFTRLIRHRYLNRELITVSEISEVYCTDSENWATQVKNIMRWSHDRIIEGVLLE